MLDIKTKYNEYKYYHSTRPFNDIIVTGDNKIYRFYQLFNIDAILKNHKHINNYYNAFIEGTHNNILYKDNQSTTKQLLLHNTMSYDNYDNLVFLNKFQYNEFHNNSKHYIKYIIPENYKNTSKNTSNSIHHKHISAIIANCTIQPLSKKDIMQFKKKIMYMLDLYHKYTQIQQYKFYEEKYSDSNTSSDSELIKSLINKMENLYHDMKILDKEQEQYYKNSHNIIQKFIERGNIS